MPSISAKFVSISVILRELPRLEQLHITLIDKEMCVIDRSEFRRGVRETLAEHSDFMVLCDKERFISVEMHGTPSTVITIVDGDY